MYLYRFLKPDDLHQLARGVFPGEVHGQKAVLVFDLGHLVPLQNQLLYLHTTHVSCFNDNLMRKSVAQSSRSQVKPDQAWSLHGRVAIPR